MAVEQYEAQNMLLSHPKLSASPAKLALGSPGGQGELRRAELLSDTTAARVPAQPEQHRQLQQSKTRQAKLPRKRPLWKS